MRRTVPSLALLALLLSATTAAAEGTRVALSVAIARVDGEPVVTTDWLDEQVAHATRAFRPFGVCFDATHTHALAAGHEALESMADRHALGAFLTRGEANVFVVASLRDVDDPTVMRMGVHWRARGRHTGHYVIISASAWETTLAHELGHFFGNPHHPTPGNLMSYEGRSDESGFDAAQGRRIANRLRGFLRSRQLRPAGAC